VKVPTGGDPPFWGEPASASWGFLQEGQADCGVIPQPTVTVWMEENGGKFLVFWLHHYILP